MGQRICSVEGCERPARSRGWCKPHYDRWIKRGSPTPTPIRYRTPQERLDALHERTPEGCLVYTGRLTPKGYGLVAVAGRMVPVHKFSWEAKNGPVPEGMELDHICRIRACFNPDHLRPVTHSQNLQNHSGKPHRADTASGVRGVTLTRTGKWEARIHLNGKALRVGIFATIQGAERAVVAARLAHYTHNEVDRRGV